MAKVIKCYTCGDTEFKDLGNDIIQCRSCKRKMEKPKDNADILERANNIRFENKDFDAASKLYDEIIRMTPDDAEAYWGKVLCTFGIEYVEDKDGTFLPTCHRTITNSILDDVDYRTAVAKASGDMKIYYAEQAQLIDEYQKNIKILAAQEDPYDVFISFKASDDHGGNTKDKELAYDAYNYLTKKLGLKVFFSAVTLKDMAGKEYEPIIYAALTSSTVMILIGTTPEYINSTWVKNEWTRYLSMMDESKKQGKPKYIISAIKGMRPEQLPSQLLSYQAVDLGVAGADIDLYNNVDRLIGNLRVANQKKEAPSGGVVNAGDVLAAEAQNLTNLGFQQLALNDIGKAASYFDRALEKNSQTASALWGKLLIAEEVTSDDQLSRKVISLTDYSLYKLALECANADEKKRFEAVAAKCDDNFRRADAKTKHNTAYRSEVEAVKYNFTKNYKDGETTLIDDKTDSLFEAYNDVKSRHSKQMSERSRISGKKSFSFGWVILCLLIAVFAVVPSFAAHSLIDKVTDKIETALPDYDVTQLYEHSTDFANITDENADYESFGMTYEQHQKLITEVGEIDINDYLWEIILFLAPLYILTFVIILLILKLFLPIIVAIIGALIGGGYATVWLVSGFLACAFMDTDWIRVGAFAILGFGVLMLVLGIVKNTKLKAQYASADKRCTELAAERDSVRDQLVLRSAELAKGINDKYSALYGDEIDDYEPVYCIAQAAGVDTKVISSVLNTTVETEYDDDEYGDYDEDGIPTIHAAAPGMMHVLLKSVKYPALTTDVLKKQLGLSYNEARDLVNRAPVFVAVDIPEKKANKLMEKLQNESCEVDLYQ